MNHFRGNGLRIDSFRNEPSDHAVILLISASLPGREGMGIINFGSGILKTGSKICKL